MHKILLFSLLLLASCSKGAKNTPPKSGELRFNIHSEPPTLDLRKATDLTSIMLIKLCFEGLTTMDQKGEPVLALAEKVEISQDQQTYLFFLKKTLWSDGQPVTAFDFEDTWKTILSPSFPSEFASDLYLIKNGKEAKLGLCPLSEVGVKALDPYTLKVELKHPASYFLTLTATHAFFPLPKHIVHTFTDFADHAGPHYIGNGPFLLKNWKHQSTLVFEKNPTYWHQEEVKIDKLSFFLVEDENSELAMFENGEIDWAGSPFSSLPLDAVPTLKKQGHLHIQPLAGTYYYIFNTEKYPLNNVHIRRAFALAVNRKEIVENITQMSQQVATALVPPILWKETFSYFKDADLEEAKREFLLGLKELGMTKEEFPTLTLSYNTVSSHHKIAQAIQGQWLDAIGIKVELKNKEWKVFLDELSHHQFEIARMGGSASYSDPMTFLDQFRYLSSSNNYSSWVNASFTKLLDQADLTADPVQRRVLLEKAEKLLISEMPILPIYFYSASYLKKPYVQGVFLTDLNDVDLKKAFIER